MHLAAVILPGLVQAADTVRIESEAPSGDGICEFRYQTISIQHDEDCGEIQFRLIPERPGYFEPTYLRVIGISPNSVVVDTASPGLIQGSRPGGDFAGTGYSAMMEVDMMAPSPRLRLDPDAYFDIYLGSQSVAGYSWAPLDLGVRLHLMVLESPPWYGLNAFPPPLGHFDEHFFEPIPWQHMPVPAGYPLDMEVGSVNAPWLEYDITLNQHRAVVDYSGLWAGPGESGMALAIQHVLSENLLAGQWMGYDHEGEPTFLLLVPGAFTSATRFEGDLIRAQGAPFGQPFDAAHLAETTVGHAVLEFSDPVNGVLDFTVDGLHQTLRIRRYLPKPPEGYSAPFLRE